VISSVIPCSSGVCAGIFNDFIEKTNSTDWSTVTNTHVRDMSMTLLCGFLNSYLYMAPQSDYRWFEQTFKKLKIKAHRTCTIYYVLGPWKVTVCIRLWKHGTTFIGIEATTAHRCVAYLDVYLERGMEMRSKTAVVYYL